MALWVRWTLMMLVCGGVATCGGDKNGNGSGLPDGSTGDTGPTDSGGPTIPRTDSMPTGRDSGFQPWTPVTLDPEDCPGSNEGVVVSNKVETTMATALHARLTWTDNGLFVVWVTLGNPTEPPQGSRIYYSLVDPADNFSPLVDGTLVAETNWTANSAATAVQWDGARLHLVWPEAPEGEEEAGRMYHRVINGDGTLGAPAQALSTSGPTEWPAIARNGTELFVAWGIRANSDDAGDLYGRFLPLTGTPDPDRGEELIAGGQLRQSVPALAPSSSGGFLAAFSRTAFVAGSTTDTAPGLASTTITFDNGATTPQRLADVRSVAPHLLLAITGGYALIYRVGYSTQQGGIYLQQLNAAGALVGAPVLLDERATQVAAHFDGTHLVVLAHYVDLAREHSQLWMSRYETDGTPVGQPGAVACGDSVSAVRQPAMVSTDNGYVIAWSEPATAPILTQLALRRWNF